MRVQARLKPCTRNHPKIQEQVLETPQRRDCPLLGEQTVIIIIIMMVILCSFDRLSSSGGENRHQDYHMLRLGGLLLG